MSRAPFVLPKAETTRCLNNAMCDTTIGQRCVNAGMKQMYGTDAMTETAKSVAGDFAIERAAQDRVAMASQVGAVTAQQQGVFNEEICAVTVPQKKEAAF